MNPYFMLGGKDILTPTALYLGCFQYALSCARKLGYTYSCVRVADILSRDAWKSYNNNNGKSFAETLIWGLHKAQMNKGVLVLN